MTWPRLLAALATAGVLALGACPAPDPDGSDDDTLHDDDTGDDDSTDDDDAGTDWQPFSLLSLNLHCLKLDGTDFASNEDRMAAIAQAVEAEGVAAIAAQEVCDDGQQDALVLLLDALEATTGTGWDSAYSFAHTGWEGTPDEAAEGLAVLARGTLLGPRTVEYHEPGELRRVGAAATLPAGLGSLHLHSLHLDYNSDDARPSQARQAAATALAQAQPELGILIAGDLNDTEGSPTHDAFGAMGYDDLSDALDDGRIDHLFAHRGGDVSAEGAQLVFTGETYPVVSDHPGVLVRLSPGTGDPHDVTTITANAPTDGLPLYVRGDTPPLSWDHGWPAYPVATDRWQLAVTEFDGQNFEYKWVADDSQWQAGGNESGVAGIDNVSTPSF